MNKKGTIGAGEKDISRRAALAVIGGVAVSGSACSALGKGKPQTLTFGIITDLHYADKEPNIGRHYADSIDKLSQAITVFRERKASFIIELGDLIDKADKETEYGYLDSIDAVYNSFDGPRHYVLGNHDVATFSKKEFLDGVGTKKAYYSFDTGGHHFIVLDANYNPDGSAYKAGNFTWTEALIPNAERNWLVDDLARSSDRPVIVFIHQNLHDEKDPHGVNNAPEIRSILEHAGNVHAVFQGHMHTGGYAEINGIHYVTFRAAVEKAGIANNAFALVSVMPDGSITIEGHGRQESRRIEARE